MTRTKPSKTALKREQHALQELGEQLIGLDEGALDALPIDERLREAVVAASRIRSRGALRRQRQRIGKLMRDADAEAIREALEQRTAKDRLAKRVFADAETWRDRVVADGQSAVDEFVAMTDIDPAMLQKLLDDLLTGYSERRSKGTRKQIFRVLHDALLARAQDDRIPR